MNDIIIQAIGFVAVAFFFISYQLRSNRALFLCQLSGCLIFCFQMCLLGTWGGVLSESIALVSILVSIARFGWKGLAENMADSAETA